jgi:hypothetical protein
MGGPLAPSALSAFPQSPERRPRLDGICTSRGIGRVRFFGYQQEAEPSLKKFYYLWVFLVGNLDAECPKYIVVHWNFRATSIVNSSVLSQYACVLASNYFEVAFECSANLKGEI